MGRVVWDGDKLLKDVENDMDRKLSQAADVVMNEALRLVPVKTGALKRSITKIKSKFKGGGYIVAAGGHDTFYWMWQEYGSSNTPRQSFLRPALAKGKRKLKNELAKP